MLTLDRQIGNNERLFTLQARNGFFTQTKLYFGFRLGGHLYGQLIPKL
jgi:hypothetical protein